MDEAAFFKAFEEVPTVNVVSYQELKDQMNTVINTILNPYNDCNKKMDAFKKLRSLIAAGAPKYDEFFTDLFDLEMCLSMTIDDLEPQLVRETCITIACLAQTSPNKSKDITEHLLRLLISVKNSTEVRATIRFILKNNINPDLIMIIWDLDSSKNQDIIRNYLEYIEVILTECPTDLLEEYIDFFTHVLGKFDTSSRRVFWGFNQHFPDQAEVGSWKQLGKNQRDRLRGPRIVAKQSDV